MLFNSLEYALLLPLVLVVVMLGLLHARDWVFALVSPWILAVLGSSLLVTMQS